jgi:endonuclease/exonuclease/phosphatase family metal-dependent hydrolase
MRIATFNVQNMRLRHGPGGDHLDGARDGDMGEGPATDPALDPLDRRLTAEVIRAIDADLIALQEVFDRATLDHFHDRYLLPTGCRLYPHRVCLPGNDGHGRDVAALSRIAPRRVTSHAAATASDLGLTDVPPEVGNGPIFRRDCLELDLPGVTVYICHFKAPYPDRARAHAVRETEARAVRRIIERRFPDPSSARWVVLGDFNEPAAPDPTRPSALDPLQRGFAVNLMERLPPQDTWTLPVPGEDRRARPDAILVSPALARACPDAKPGIFRAGMDPGAARTAGAGFATVRDPRPHASDHAAVHVDLEGL